MDIKTTGQSYYDAMPSIEMRAGDVWRDLPAFGHLRSEKFSGIVITPACDLSNRKVETVTYLPIVPIKSYFFSRGFAVELVRVVKSQCSNVEISNPDDWRIRGVGLPDIQVMQRTLNDVEQVMLSSIGAKVRASAERIKSAITVLKVVRACGPDAGLSVVRHALGDKEYERILGEICRNSYSSDIHFLPSDGKVGDMSVIPNHAVALFRYPMAVPVELLDHANDVAVANWQKTIRSLESEMPIAKFLADVRPIKVGSLKPRFLADLISRFAVLHIRMGSPDFTRETIEEFVNSFGAEK